MSSSQAAISTPRSFDIHNLHSVSHDKLLTVQALKTHGQIWSEEIKCRAYWVCEKPHGILDIKQQ